MILLFLKSGISECESVLKEILYSQQSSLLKDKFRYLSGRLFVSSQHSVLQQSSDSQIIYKLKLLEIRNVIKRIINGIFLYFSFFTK